MNPAIFNLVAGAASARSPAHAGALAVGAPDHDLFRTTLDARLNRTVAKLKAGGTTVVGDDSQNQHALAAKIAKKLKAGVPEADLRSGLAEQLAASLEQLLGSATVSTRGQLQTIFGSALAAPAEQDAAAAGIAERSGILAGRFGRLKTLAAQLAAAAASETTARAGQPLATQATSAVADAHGQVIDGKTAFTDTDVASADAQAQRALEPNITQMLERGVSEANVRATLATLLSATVAEQRGTTTADARQQLQTIFGSALAPPGNGAMREVPADRARILAQRFSRIKQLATQIAGQSSGQQTRFAGNVLDAKSAKDIPALTETSGLDTPESGAGRSVVAQPNPRSAYSTTQSPARDSASAALLSKVFGTGAITAEALPRAAMPMANTTDAAQSRKAIVDRKAATRGTNAVGDDAFSQRALETLITEELKGGKSEGDVVRTLATQLSASVGAQREPAATDVRQQLQTILGSALTAPSDRAVAEMPVTDRARILAQRFTILKQLATKIAEFATPATTTRAGPFTATAIASMADPGVERQLNLDGRATTAADGSVADDVLSRAALAANTPQTNDFTGDTGANRSDGGLASFAKSVTALLAGDASLRGISTTAQTLAPARGIASAPLLPLQKVAQSAAFVPPIAPFTLDRAMPVAPPVTPAAPQPAPDQASIVDQVLRGAFMRNTGESSEMRLSLVPQTLGDVNIKLVVTADNVTAHVIAQTPEVRDALVAAQPQLSKSLADAGLKLQSFTVDLSGSGFAGFSQQQQDRSPGRNHPSYPARSSADELAEATLEAVPSFAPPSFGKPSAGDYNYLV